MDCLASYSLIHCTTLFCGNPIIHLFGKVWLVHTSTQYFHRSLLFENNGGTREIESVEIPRYTYSAGFENNGGRPESARKHMRTLIIRKRARSANRFVFAPLARTKRRGSGAAISLNLKDWDGISEILFFDFKRWDMVGFIWSSL